MRKIFLVSQCAFFSLATLFLAGCANVSGNSSDGTMSNNGYIPHLPEYMDTHGQKLVVVNPNVHGWGAYDANGRLVRSGMATAGGATCPPDDTDEPSCKTHTGTFHIMSLGDGNCISKIYPKPEGGGLMPYCMFFSGGQALHGSPDSTVVADNISHGCVRMRIPDAEWMRNNFAQVGTKVVVVPY